MEKQLNANKVKAHQRGTDTEHRALPYLNWHRSELDRQAYALDVDHIEWRKRDGKLVPVATIELTRVDRKAWVNEKYLDAILKRFNRRDLQGYASRYVAAMLKVPCYIVLFSADLLDFWVYNLTENTGWQHQSQAEMVDFLNNL